MATSRTDCSSDEAAIPAIARAAEEMPADARMTALISIEDESGRQAIASPARLDVRWVMGHGADPSDATLLSHAVAGFASETGCFVWVATEVRVARALRKSLIEQHCVAPRWMKVAGYWMPGLANTTEQNIEE